MTDRRTMTCKEWETEAERRFGPDQDCWKFVCPVCGHVASVADWRKAGASEGMVAFSCIGRSLGATKGFDVIEGGPCIYAGGGLFRLNPVTVVFENGSTRQTFAFAEAAP